MEKTLSLKNYEHLSPFIKKQFWNIPVDGFDGT